MISVLHPGHTITLAAVVDGEPVSFSQLRCDAKGVLSVRTAKSLDEFESERELCTNKSSC